MACSNWLIFREAIRSIVVASHRSIEALRSYERVSLEQEKSLSKVLMSNVSFENAGVEASVKEKNDSSNDIGRIFGDLSNCQVTVNVSFAK